MSAATPLPPPAPTAPRTAAEPVLPSQALMQGRRSVVIDHHGTAYRLQVTRQGKLILTK